MTGPPDRILLIVGRIRVDATLDVGLQRYVWPPKQPLVNALPASLGALSASKCDGGELAVALREDEAIWISLDRIDARCSPSVFAFKVLGNDDVSRSPCICLVPPTAHVRGWKLTPETCAPFKRQWCSAIDLTCNGTSFRLLLLEPTEFELLGTTAN
jgi:hypothetical protein